MTQPEPNKGHPIRLCEPDRIRIFFLFKIYALFCYLQYLTLQTATFLDGKCWKWRLKIEKILEKYEP